MEIFSNATANIALSYRVLWVLKSRAVANANSIPGYDDDAAAVQTGTAK